MTIFESLVIVLLLTLFLGMLLISKWLIAIMFEARLVKKEIQRHNLIDLELRFFRFLHFNGYEKKDTSSYYLGKILNIFKDSDIIDNEEKDNYRRIYETFKKNQEN